MSQQIDSNSILRLKAVRALTGVSRSTIWRLCRRGEFPQPLKLTARLIGWRAAEVQQWLDSRERGGPALTEVKDELSESRRDLGAHGRKESAARKRRGSRAGDSSSSGLRERGTARGTNGTLHKVSSGGDAAGVGAEESCDPKGDGL
jgi:prophage regulatory protein